MDCQKMSYKITFQNLNRVELGFARSVPGGRGEMVTKLTMTNHEKSGVGTKFTLGPILESHF